MMLGRLLEMSTVEFEEEIVRMLEENPALAISEISADGNEPIETNDNDFADDSDDEPRVALPLRKGIDFRQVAGDVTEADYVESQLNDLDLSDAELLAAHYIIGNLDSSGYLTRSAAAIVDDIAATAGVEMDISTVVKMIALVKSLDPAGIGAANLQECLMLQLERMESNPCVEVARRIVESHYDDFVNNRLSALRSSLGISEDELAKALKLIKALNPKPGAGLHEHVGDERLRHINPDFLLEFDDDGRLAVSLAGQIPQLEVDSVFLADEESLAKEAKEFIRERREGAEIFIDAVKRRGNTLMKLIRSIIKLQPLYFRTFNRRDLRPMVISDIEELAGLDKSVVSRACSAKYMLTPQGEVVLLKDLFSEKASSADDVGRHQVEGAIRDILNSEDKAHPLSDDALCRELAKQGMNVARRTVTKYRERLGFPVARLRRT